MPINKNFWKDKTVAVTGGSGFIGSHFIEELVKQEIKTVCVSSKKHQHEYLKKTDKKFLHCLKLDLTNEQETIKKIKKLDVIINCAALDGNTEFKIKYAAKILDHNLKIVLNILNAAIINKIKDVVLFSSAEVYPATAKNPIKEEDDYRKHFDNLENGYVLSKRFSEIIGLMYAKQHGLHVYLPRPTNVYGERDKFDADSNRVIPSMIKKILKGEKLEIWGDGKQVRNFIYVKNLVYSVITLLEIKQTAPVNISSNEISTIYDLAQKIGTLSQKKPNIAYLKDKPTGVKIRYLDSKLIYSLIHFEMCTLNIGLKKTINWHLSKNHLG
jgi:dTDP-4-dehydro-6-deoxy-alpha-D-gulose 4-ketoreductase